MPQLISQDEFEQLLSGDAPDLAPFPVFVAPKMTDRGYFKRRETLTRYQTAQAKLVTAFQDLQREGARIDKRSAAIQKEIDSLKAARENEAETTGDTDGFDEKIAAFRDELDALEDEAAPVRSRLMELAEQIDGAAEEQVTLILPYIKAVKYPQADGSFQFWPRPTDEDEVKEFEATVRGLLKDISQEDFETMTSAITGATNGARAVPPPNGSK